MSPITIAIELLGLKRVADLCGVSYQAVRKWERNKMLPRTEWTGETCYASTIEEATNKRVTRAMLLQRQAAEDSRDDAP